MGGKVDQSIWNISTLLKWEAKLAHWSGTKWTDSMFYSTSHWKSITNREKWKSEKEANILSLPRSEDWFKIFGISFFQTLIPFFCYLLIFVKKVLKANIYAFTKTNFLTPSLTLTNMSNMFFCPFHPFLPQFFQNKKFQRFLGS